MRSTVAGPDRLVEHDRVVGHHRLGQVEALLQVEVHLQRQRLLRAARRPVVRAEPHREHRRRRDRAAGDLVGDVVVPEERVAVLDRRADRPDVAALDGELARLLVLHLADQRLDVGRARSSSRGHSFLAQRRDLVGASSRPRRSSASVSVIVGVAHARAAAARGPCPRAPGRPGGSRPCRGACASTNTPRAREVRVVDELGHRSRPRDTHVSAGAELGDPLVAVARARTRRAKSARISSCTASSVWCASHCSQPSALAEVARRSAARSRRPRPTCRRAQR